VRVQNESLAFAQKTLSDTKKQVEIGSLAPIEVVRAQSTVATDQQAVTKAQTDLQLQQLLMKNAISRFPERSDAGYGGGDSDLNHGRSGAGAYRSAEDLINESLPPSPGIGRVANRFE